MLGITAARSSVARRWRGWRAAACIGLAVAPVAVLGLPGLAASASVAGKLDPHKGIVPPSNPSRSLAAEPDYQASAKCTGSKDTRSCNDLVLRAITHARSVLEDLGPMRFSIVAFDKLTKDQQLLATVNIERRARGLSPVTELTQSLDKIAQVGAVDDTDPSLSIVCGSACRLPGGGVPVSGGSNWASGFDNPLGSDYGWMYDDGPGGPNGECTEDHVGCWGHRDNILHDWGSSSANCGGEQFQTVMGAGYVAKSKDGYDSETELFVGVCGATPTDVVATWSQIESKIDLP